MDAALEAAVDTDEGNGIAAAEMQCCGVVGMHEDRVARGAGEGVDLGIDEGVELLAAAAADDERAGLPLRRRQRHRDQAGAAVGGREVAAGREMRSAVLKRLA